MRNALSDHSALCGGLPGCMKPFKDAREARKALSSTQGMQPFLAVAMVLCLAYTAGISHTEPTYLAVVTPPSHKQ